MELLSNMELFVEVAKAKGFRRAAEILDIPNSTLSRRVAQLEKLVGVRLLHRSTRKVELTAAGEVYFRRCEGIVSEARLAHESLLDQVERPSGVLRVSMPVDFAISFLVPVIQAFGQKYPLISFELDLTPRNVDLMTDGFDFAVRMGPPPQIPSTLIARPLGLLAHHLYASPTYLKSAPPLRHPSDLLQHVCLLQAGPRTSMQWVLRSTTEEVVLPLTSRYAMNSNGLCKAMAREAMGIVVAAVDNTREDVVAGRLQRVLPGWSLPPLPVHAIIESRLLPARVRLFIDFIIESLHVQSLDSPHLASQN